MKLILSILLLISLQGFSQQGFYGYLTNNTWRGMGATQKAHLPADTFNVTGNLKNYKWIAIKSGSIWLWQQSQNKWVLYSSGGGSSNTYTLPLLNTSGVVTIKGLTTVGLNGQVPISNGTQWAYHYPFNHDSASMYSFETGEGLEVIDGGVNLDTVRVKGTVKTTYAAKTSAYTITNNDHTIHCTSGTFTVMLPTAVGIAGREFLIKNTGAGTITVDGNGSETIDAGTTYPLTQYKFILVKSTGANWIITGNN